ncbi:hypothetical protein LUZ60_017223 [Juncus effusus]|nr:hypothetical protein LUZ60_017223 [Juncus effusus]
MGEDYYEEEPLSSMWPEDIEDKSNKKFNIEKQSHTEQILLKELNFKEDQHQMDFKALSQLTDYSDKGSHQLTSLVKQYKFRKENAVRLLHEEINSLSKQRLEIEQKELEILREHRFVEKNQISVLEENLDLWDSKNCSVSNLKIDLGLCEKIEEVTGEEGDVNYWRGKVAQLERMLRESLKRENLLEQKLNETVKGLEEQNSPVEELSRILKRADNFLHFILQNAPVVIAHQDTELKYRFIYNHFPALGEEDIIGKTDEEILSGPGVIAFQKFKREVLENRKAAKREITYETPLFGKKTFLTYVEPVFNKQGEIIGINYIGLEVSDQVKMREKLARNREELAVQKAKETELSKTIVITEETMRAKQMLATMSHEIRSPLTGVVSMAEILANTKLDKDQRQLIDVMLSSGDLVLQLINDILDLSKAESGVMRLEETKFRPREVVKHVLQTAAAALKKDLILEGHISNDVPLEVLGDVLRIRQIFTNLISNAVKFTHKGKVGIDLRVVPKPESNLPNNHNSKQEKENHSANFKSNNHNLMLENNSSESSQESQDRCEGETSCSNSSAFNDENTVWLQCDVYDTGIGIPANAKSTLFTRYMQASADHARKYGGTGLGLAICKQLVEELMNGEILVESKEQEGSKFTFKIPCKIPPKIENSDDSDDSVSQIRESKSGISNPGFGDVMQGFFLFKPKMGQRRKQTSPVPPSSPVCVDLNLSLNLGEKDKGFRVLLVDDNKVNIIVAKNMLHQLGHKFDIVNNGLEAIRAVQSTQFDLIFMDVHMPVMDGIQATRLIRSFEQNGFWDPSVGPTCQNISQESFDLLRLRKRTPIIAMTANAYGESATECLASGMDSYISKPVTFQNLKQVLQNFLPCKT